MKKWEKNLVSAAGALALVLCAVPGASAMHIMEGYLPPVYCVAWGALCLPFLAWGLASIRRLSGNSARRCFCWLWRARLYSSSPR